MSKNVGQPIVRNEDLRLITGAGEFSDDRNMPDQAYAAVLRSTHAHAQIKGINRSRAQKMPGVLLILTGKDWQDADLLPLQNNPIPSARTDPTLFAPGGGLPHARDQYPLPVERVHFAGEPVVMVIAETLAQARDAAEAIDVTYEVMDANANTARADQSELLWDNLENNLCVDSDLGDPNATEEAFRNADRIVNLTVNVGRVTGVPMEPRAALANYNQDTDSYSLYAGGGGALRHRSELALLAGVPDERMRVVCGDVGGNYGTRNRVYPEFPLLLHAAKTLNRPVKWTADRSECMLSDLQGRDLISELSLALDKDGKFLAMRGRNTSNAGGYTVAFAPLAKGAGISTGPYDIEPATLRLRAVVSNTPPTNPYRSAGRPECVFALERLIDTAARELDIDRIELRRKNLIRPDQLPYENPQGMLYDSGEFKRTLDIALEKADYANFETRRVESETRGLKRGIGIAPYIETSSGAPMEWSCVSILSDGVHVAVGTQSSGQGHETSFAQVAADWLRIPFDKVLIQQGNTDVAKAGNGSHAGRSMRMAGTAIVLASNQVIEKGKALAAFVLEAAFEDIEFGDGEFRIQGTDRTIDWFSLAREAEREDLPDELQGGLNAELKNIMHEAVFPNGCHICEVVVDPETGAVTLERYTAVDDVGRVINPLIVDGQIHGGIVQGAGQALMERCFFDEETAQPYAGSFMDYAMPRADDMPFFSVTYHEVISPQNPLGVKSGGESGTTPAPAVIINAVVDALYDLGVRDIEMPATPHRVWQAIQEAQI
ncbi:MAG: molybdopterin-dependent oxidoreductase [Alphaproteobacteria bacterium]|nr:molybdopterin-dependent oxidoreductase [Alphaproteobacteria bacterium]